MFSITSNAIEIENLRTKLEDAHSGAYVSFEGLVRNHNEGKQVRSLEYEAFIEMAEKIGQQIVEEARQQFAVDQIIAIHRIGHLQLEEAAVWIGVSSAHRDAAFKACRYLIDQIKTRVPIWKREHYANGHAHWVNCQHCYHAVGNAPKDLEIPMYQRQTRLAEIGDTGQARLKAARVAVVGAGALACASLPYLAAAGIGHISIFDDDQVELSNLHRQTLYHFADQGQYKAKLAEKRLSEQNPFIKIEGFIYRIENANIEQHLKAYDLIIDCTDNFKTKYLIHDFAYLNKIPLVQASIHKFEAQLHVFREFKHSCLRCLWPEEPDPSCIGNCAEVGVLGSTAGVTGALQAQEAIKIILGLPGLKDTEMLVLDLMNLRQETLLKPREQDCPLCGSNPSIRELSQRPSRRRARDGFDLSIQDLQELTYDFRIVDIRQDFERNPKSAFQNSLIHIPHQDLDSLISLAGEDKYLLVCQAGVRSRQTAARLQALGFQNFYALTDGIAELEAEKT